MIACRAMLDVSRALARYLSRLLNAERRERGAPTPQPRADLLSAGGARVALVPGGPRCDRADVGLWPLPGDRYRYLDEVIEVLDSQAPDLHDVLQRAKGNGLTHLVLDAKTVPL